MWNFIALSALFVGCAWAICPLGSEWVEADGLCFRIVKQLQNFNQAKETCQRFSTASCQSQLLDTRNVARVAAAYSLSAEDNLIYRINGAHYGSNAHYFSHRRPRCRINCPHDSFGTWCLDFDTPMDATDEETLGLDFMNSKIRGILKANQKAPSICQSCGGTNHPDQCESNNIAGYDGWIPIPNNADKCYKINLGNRDKVFKSVSNCEGQNNIRLLHAMYAADVIDDLQAGSHYLAGDEIFRIAGLGRPGYKRYVDSYDTTDKLTFPGSPYSYSDMLPMETQVSDTSKTHKYSLGINVTAGHIVGNVAFDMKYFSICQSDS